jgi:hypothetical protein
MAVIQSTVLPPLNIISLLSFDLTNLDLEEFQAGLPEFLLDF